MKIEDLKFGVTLPNGLAEVVTLVHLGNRYYVLAYREWHAEQPWVTWEVNVQCNCDTHTGHYFNDFFAATHDLQERALRGR